MEQRDVIDQCRSPPPCHCLAAGAGGAHERRSASAMRAASAVSKARSTRNSTSASSGQEGGGKRWGRSVPKKVQGGNICVHACARAARVCGGAGRGVNGKALRARMRGGWGGVERGASRMGLVWGRFRDGAPERRERKGGPQRRRLRKKRKEGGGVPNRTTPRSSHSFGVCCAREGGRRKRPTTAEGGGGFLWALNANWRAPHSARGVCVRSISVDGGELGRHRCMYM